MEANTLAKKSTQKDMQIPLPSFITQHIAIWALGVVGVLLWGGVTAYLKLEHVTRAEFITATNIQTYNLQTAIHAMGEQRILDKLDEADAEIERLELYNRLGSSTNQPARDQVIVQTENRKQKWERELKLLEAKRPKLEE